MLAAKGRRGKGENPAGDGRYDGSAYPVPIAGVLIGATQTQPDLSDLLSGTTLGR